MPSRYITKFNSAYSVGDVLWCHAIDGHEAQFEELTSHGSARLCYDMAGIGPWPPPKQHYHILLYETIHCSLWPPFSNDDWVTSQLRPPWPPPQLDRNNLFTDSVQLRPIPWPNFIGSDTMIVCSSVSQFTGKLLFADISGESWQYWLESHETAVQLGGMKWKDTRQSQFSVGINVHLQKIGEHFSIYPDITNLAVLQSRSVKCCLIQWEISWPLCTMVCWFGEGLLVITTLQLLWQCCTRGVEFLFLRQPHEHMQGSKFSVWTAFQLPLSLFESVKPWPCAISLSATVMAIKLKAGGMSITELSCFWIFLFYLRGNIVRTQDRNILQSITAGIGARLDLQYSTCSIKSVLYLLSYLVVMVYYLYMFHQVSGCRCVAKRYKVSAITVIVQ